MTLFHCVWGWSCHSFVCHTVDTLGSICTCSVSLYWKSDSLQHFSLFFFVFCRLQDMSFSTDCSDNKYLLARNEWPNNSSKLNNTIHLSLPSRMTPPSTSAVDSPALFQNRYKSQLKTCIDFPMSQCYGGGLVEGLCLGKNVANFLHM